MEPVQPINTLELFPPLSRELIKVLRALQPTDWSRPTVCAPWSVKDVAGHLLGGNLGRLWKVDETSTPRENPVQDYDELVNLIHRDNEFWVHAAQRISPEILIEFLDLTDHHLYDHFRSLAQNELARITVAWAGNSLAPNWFDIAREYTEKWLHQQHIREAVSRPLLIGRKWLSPVLNTFMRGLPHNYRNLEAKNGTSISVQVTGEAGGEWSLVREGFLWHLFVGRDPRATCCVQIDQNLAWRLFTKGINREDARRQVQIDGNVELGEKVLEMVSIMALLE
jgi:uncharacterized protein (TIGR03083 family)